MDNVWKTRLRLGFDRDSVRSDLEDETDITSSLVPGAYVKTEECDYSLLRLSIGDDEGHSAVLLSSAAVDRLIDDLTEWRRS